MPILICYKLYEAEVGLRHIFAAVIFISFAPSILLSQGNYEVQVYPSDLIPPGFTMLELHSNFTVSGTRGVLNGVLPTNHAQHETFEITHGFNDWFETGLYQFMSIQPGGGWEWVGSHVRPRISIPERYRLPVGLSLSVEFGYQRPNFDADTWTCEIRPIVDKKIGKLYMALNPTLEKSFHGPGQASGVEFSPNVKVSYDVLKKVALGLEYYGGYGPLTSWDPLSEQQHQFIPAIDIDFGPRWEFNFGVGVGATRGTDHLLVKAILGYRLGNRGRP
jgi:hypothetical protein